jgi:hypothetical protein
MFMMRPFVADARTLQRMHARANTPVANHPNGFYATAPLTSTILRAAASVPAETEAIFVVPSMLKLLNAQETPQQ